MATPVHADALVPGMWRSATDRALADPDWPEGAMPTACQLTDAEYRALLRSRCGGAVISEGDTRVEVSTPTWATLVVWSGTAFGRQ